MTSATGRLLTSAEVVAETGVTYRQLDHWTTRGYVTPATVEGTADVDPAAPGSGRIRLWTPAETRVIADITCLVAEGWRPAAAASHARADRPVDLGRGYRLHPPRPPLRRPSSVRARRVPRRLRQQITWGAR